MNYFELAMTTVYYNQAIQENYLNRKSSELNSERETIAKTADCFTKYVRKETFFSDSIFQNFVKRKAIM